MEDIWFAVKNPGDYYFDIESVKQRKKVIAPYKENGIPKDWKKTDEGNFRLTYPSNFWDDISIPFWSMPENTDHPTQKPEKRRAEIFFGNLCYLKPVISRRNHSTEIIMHAPHQNTADRHDYKDQRAKNNSL